MQSDRCAWCHLGGAGRLRRIDMAVEQRLLTQQEAHEERMRYKAMQDLLMYLRNTETTDWAYVAAEVQRLKTGNNLHENIRGGFHNKDYILSDLYYRAEGGG